MNTSITDKLPIESIGETITGTLQGPVADSVHRVGEFVPDPDTVVDVVSDGVAHGRRFGRNVVQQLPGRDKSPSAKRWVVVGAVIGLASLAFVFWRARNRGDQSDVGTRDDWSASGTASGATNRVVAGPLPTVERPITVGKPGSGRSPPADARIARDSSPSHHRPATARPHGAGPSRVRGPTRQPSPHPSSSVRERFRHTR